MARHKTSHKRPDVDDWFVFIIVSVVTMLNFGLIFAFGALFVAMIETFQSDRSSTASVQSLLVGISLSFSIVSGAVISKFGLLAATWVSSFMVPLGFMTSFFINEIQYLYITISFISGIGISTIHVVSVVVIQRLFPPSFQPLCFAIHGVGVNIAGIIYPFIIEMLLESYGVHWTFLLLGGMFLNNFAAAIILFNNTKFRRKTTEKAGGNDNFTDKLKDNVELKESLIHEFEHVNHSEDRITNGSKLNGAVNNLPADLIENQDTGYRSKSHIELWCSILRNTQYVLLLLASVLCIPASNTFLGLTVDIFIWKGFTASQGLISFVPFNVLSLLAKFIPVIAKKYKKGLSCFVLPFCFCIIGVLSQLIVYFSSGYIIMLIGTSLVGMSLGGVFPAMLIAGAKIVSEREWPVASGLLMTVIGVLSSGLGPVLGLLRDRTGTYTASIVIIGSMQVAGALLYITALIARKNEFTRNRNTEIVPEEGQSMTMIQNGMDCL